MRLPAVALACVLCGGAVLSVHALPATERSRRSPLDTGANPCADGVADISATIQVCTMITGSVGLTYTLLTTPLALAASTTGIPGIGPETIFTTTVGGVAFYHGMAEHLPWTISVLQQVLPPGVLLMGQPIRPNVHVGDAVTIQFVCLEPPCDRPAPTSTPFLTLTPRATATATPTVSPTDAPPPTATLSPTPTPSSTVDPTPTPSVSPTMSPTDTTAPPTATRSPTAVVSPSPSATSPPTATDLASATATPTASVAPTAQATITSPPSPTAGDGDPVRLYLPYGAKARRSGTAWQRRHSSVVGVEHHDIPGSAPLLPADIEHFSRRSE